MAILSWSPYLTASTFYVSTIGNDATGDGSMSRPWRTIKYAATRVPPRQGHTIFVHRGTYVEDGPIEIPLQVNLEGAGAGQTIIKGSPPFYYHPQAPAYATEKFLIRLNEFNPSNGSQFLRNFSIDGDAKQLHGGIYVRHRSNVRIENINIQDTNFSAMWLWDVKDSAIENVYLFNCSWGSVGYSVGAVNLGNVERVEIKQLYVNENRGYGIKAIGPSGHNNIVELRIHDSHISVNPVGLWNNGSAPNIAIELWQVNLVRCEIFDCYVDNTISLVNSNAIPSTGVQTIRVHDNIIDLETRAQGAGYGLELTIHDAEVDHNYFVKGTYGIANWDNPMKNWTIHHNVFYGLRGTYPGEILRSQWSGLHNVKFYNNTIEFAGNETMSVIGVYGSISKDVDIRNNLVINSSTGFSYFPHELIHAENGATIDSIRILNNSAVNLKPGKWLESLLQSIINPVVPGADIDLTELPNPAIVKAGLRPQPYYFPASGSSLINAGANLGFPFLSDAPDIGALEYGASPSVNSAPFVDLISPGDAAIISAGSDVKITANASDRDGTVSKVEFFSGATKLGESLTRPYSFVWRNVAPGAYSITARATDDLLAARTSAAIDVSISPTNAPPYVSLTSPENNKTTAAGSSLMISANADDPDGSVSKVEFFNGAIKIGEDLTIPYTLTWTNVPAGTATLTAKATDNLNSSTISQAVIVTATVVNVPPTIRITSPVNNASLIAGATVQIITQAADSDGTIKLVEFFDGSLKIGETLSGPFSFSWSNISVGLHTLTAKATDNLNATAISAPVTISVTNPNLAPVVTVQSPASGSVFTVGSPVTITATASDSDGTISLVEFFAGPNKLGEDLTAPYSLTLNNPRLGAYAITAKATDDQNATSTSPLIIFIVSVLDKPPVVELLLPEEKDAYYEGDTILLMATVADDDVVSRVEFFSGTTKLGEDGSKPYELEWSRVPADTYQLTAKAWDNNGASSSSSPVTLVVNRHNIFPVVRLNAPGNKETFTAHEPINLLATATDIDGSIGKVEFFFGTHKIGEVSSAPYRLTWTDAPVGPLELTARATDNQGAATISDRIRIDVLPGRLQVHPNPANEQFSVRVHCYAAQEIQLRIIDQVGRTMSLSRIAIQPGLVEIPVDSRPLGAGTYIVRVDGADIYGQSTRLIILK